MVSQGGMREGSDNHKGNILMADANATVDPLQARKILHVAQTTLVILTASEQRRR